MMLRGPCKLYKEFLAVVIIRRLKSGCRGSVGKEIGIVLLRIDVFNQAVIVGLDEEHKLHLNR